MLRLERRMNTFLEIQRLHLSDGLSFREISQRTGLTPGEARVWIGLASIPVPATTTLAPASARTFGEANLLPKANSLRYVFDIWRKVDGIYRTASTVRNKERAVKAFENFFPDADIGNITRAQGGEFKAHLHTFNLASGSKRLMMNDLKALLNYAYTRLELIPRSPWYGIGFFSQTEGRRYPWTLPELSVLFGLPLFSQYELPSAGISGVDAAYWLPLLAMFTGARIGELCQLETSDVVQVGEVWVLDINQKGRRKRLKSPASVRRIPVHSKLIELGFLDYSQTTREAGSRSLWPALVSNKRESVQYFSSWFSSFKRGAAPNSTLPDLHSFRHTVRTKMNKARISVRVQDEITGHVTFGNHGTTTYTHPDMDDLVEAIESIQYVGLSMPKVYRVIDRLASRDKLTLREWANATFESPPSAGAVRGWLRRCQIHPKPVLIGTCYFVSPSAVRIFERRPQSEGGQAQRDRARRGVLELMLHGAVALTSAPSSMTMP